MAFGSDISVGGDHGRALAMISAADMVGGFRYVFAAATVMLAVAAFSMIAMEERPLAAP